MRTAAAIDAATRLIVLAVAILFYQWFIVTYLEHEPQRAWAPQLWKKAQNWWSEHHRVELGEPWRAIRLKRTVELPQEPTTEK